MSVIGAGEPAAVPDPWITATLAEAAALPVAPPSRRQYWRRSEPPEWWVKRRRGSDFEHISWSQYQDCCQREHNWGLSRGSFGLLITCNGGKQIYSMCGYCGAKLVDACVSKATVVAAGLDPECLPVIQINPLAPLSRCQHCRRYRRDIESHHWAPWHLFEDSNAWGTVPLCGSCHDIWHKVMTPDASLIGKLQKRIGELQARVAGLEGETVASKVAVRDGSLRISDDVIHEKWGIGVVVGLFGSGSSAEVSVQFASGEKRLLLAWAPLRRLSSLQSMMQP